jgi:hypothetical protein
VLEIVLESFERAGAKASVVDFEVPIAPGKLAHAVIDLTLDDRTARFVVEQRRRAPYLGELDQLTRLDDGIWVLGLPLLVAPAISQGLGERLVELGWSWADENGNCDLRAPGLRLRKRVMSKPPSPKFVTLPRGTGSWAVIKWLIRHASVPSVSSLAFNFVTMPRVYQVIQDLVRRGLVERSGHGLLRVHVEQLLDRFLGEYLGPGGPEMYFYSPDEPLTVAMRLATQEPHLAPAVLVSADVGPDLLVPWRRPTHLVLYTDPTVRFDKSSGLVPAYGPDDANVTQRCPDDRSVFALTERVEVDGQLFMVADPVQQLADLAYLGGTNAWK